MNMNALVLTPRKDRLFPRIPSIDNAALGGSPYVSGLMHNETR